MSTLEIWNERLVDLGSEIIEARGALVARLRPHVEEAYVAIAGESQRAELANELSILGAQPEEDPAAPDAAVRTEISAAEAVAAFTNALALRRRAELDRGLTLVGPHRDDLLLTLNGLPARGYASHGESWSFALSLKLASAALLRAESPAGDPVLILDDVFAELDQDRRGRLAAAVRDYEQVLITAAVLGDVPERVRDPRHPDQGRAYPRPRGVMNEPESGAHRRLPQAAAGVRRELGSRQLERRTPASRGRRATNRACRTASAATRAASRTCSTTSPRRWAGSPRSRARSCMAAWSEIVGAETAAHSTPVGIEEGVLTVRCDSTAWAQQLRTMRVQVTTRIAEQHDAAGIESVRFLGPDTPSWKRGPRAIPGRGPRDTYG